jgi:hypothetical protein
MERIKKEDPMKCKFLKNCSITSRYAMMLIVGALSMTGTASATLIESIAALDDGDKYRVLFVTSTLRDAKSSEITDYNTFVSNAAVSGSVTGSMGLTWKALASTENMNAQDNIGVYNGDNSSITMFNTSGQIVASSGADLWDGVLDNPILYDESAEQRREFVWTGSHEDGGTGVSLGGVEATAGYTSNESESGVHWDVRDTQWSYALYSVSSVVVKTQTDVPEPGTVILLSLGLAGLSFARYRKQS